MVSEWNIEGMNEIRDVFDGIQLTTHAPEGISLSGVSLSLEAARVWRISIPARFNIEFEIDKPGHVYAMIPRIGRGELNWGDSVARATRGRVYTVAEPGRGTLNTFSPMGFLVVEIPLEALAGSSALDALAQYPRREFHLSELSLWLLEALCDYLCISSKPFDDNAIRDAKAAILSLLEYHSPSHDVDQPTDTGAPTTLHREAMHIIASDFRDPHLNAPNLALRLGVSSRSLYRAFESHASSLTREIRRRRVDLAEHLLCSPQYARAPLSEIARLCGAPSTAYLRLAMKEKHGISPTQFRQSWARM